MNPPILRVAACALLANPAAGKPAGDDFEACIAASIPGNAKRAAPGRGSTSCWAASMTAGNYDAMDTMEIRVPGAPRADEILLAVAFATGRPNARIQGASEATVRELVAKLRG